MSTEQKDAETLSALLTGAGFASWSGTENGRPYVALHEETAHEIVTALVYYQHNARPDSVTLLVNSAEGLIGRIEGYRGPVPKEGQYIFHPPLNDDGISDQSVRGTGVMHVKSVTYGILTRPQHGEEHFTGRPVQVVEVFVG